MTGKFRTTSVAATMDLGRRLAEQLAAGDCVALDGDLGAGKTQLVRGIALGLGLADERMVSSPTFVLVQEYPCRVPLFHIDLYRMADAGRELYDLGLGEMLRQGVAVIEWAAKAGEALPRPRWHITIRHASKRSRVFDVKHVG